jgi:hypothetical protein
VGKGLSRKMPNKTTTVNIGPCPVPLTPTYVWDSWPKGTDYEAFWRIVGPTVEKHSQRYPMWKVFVAVYLEGLAHGFQVGQLIEEN